jgi:TolA-binding protein
MRGEFLRLIFATLLLLGFGTAATAQVETPVAVEPMDTIEQLETKLKSLSSSADLEEASKQQRIDFLTRAIEALRREQNFQTRLQQLKESAQKSAGAAHGNRRRSAVTASRYRPHRRTAAAGGS